MNIEADNKNDIGNFNTTGDTKLDFYNFFKIENKNNNNNLDENICFEYYIFYHNIFYGNYTNDNIFLGYIDFYKNQIDNIYFYEKIYYYYNFILILLQLTFYSYFIYYKINIITSLLMILIHIVDLYGIYKLIKHLFKIIIPENIKQNINNFTNIKHLKLIILYNSFIHSMVFFKIFKICIYAIIYSFLCIIFNQNIYFIFFHIINTCLSVLYISFLIMSVIRKY